MKALKYIAGICLLCHRRDYAEDGNPQQSRSSSAEERNHHPEMEPQRFA